MDSRTGQHAKPSRRRWRGAAIAGAAAVVLVAGLATANAATTSGQATSGQSTSGATGVAAVVDDAEAFLDTLSSAQKAEALLDLTQKNAVAWSNLACGTTCRPGIELGTLSSAQLAAAKSLLAAAMGTGDSVGFDQAEQIRSGDDVLAGGTTSTASPSAGTTSRPSAGSSTSTTTRPTGTASTDPQGGGSGPSSTTASLDSAVVAASEGPASGGPSGRASASARPTATQSTGTEYGSGHYFLAFLGTPSDTGTWQLHFGGDHLAVNLTYADGAVTSASPYFAGAEPVSFTSGGTTVQPLETMRAASAALAGSLTTAEAGTASLGDSIDDVLLGPGDDGEFPQAKAGIAVSELSADQQQLVLAAIEQWVAVADDATAEELTQAYAAELDQTYVAFAGGADFKTAGDYLRIDGPGVWIEFLCRTGTADADELAYQSVYRDHNRDYGGLFTF